MRTTPTPTPRKRGRPRKEADDGTSVREQPAFSVRMPEGDYAHVRAAAKVLNMSVSAVLLQAFRLWITKQPDRDRTDVRRQLDRDLKR